MHNLFGLSNEMENSNISYPEVHSSLYIFETYLKALLSLFYKRPTYSLFHKSACTRNSLIYYISFIFQFIDLIFKFILTHPHSNISDVLCTFYS